MCGCGRWRSDGSRASYGSDAGGGEGGGGGDTPGLGYQGRSRKRTAHNDGQCGTRTGRAQGHRRQPSRRSAVGCPSYACTALASLVQRRPTGGCAAPPRPRAPIRHARTAPRGACGCRPAQPPPPWARGRALPHMPQCRGRHAPMPLPPLPAVSRSRHRGVVHDETHPRSGVWHSCSDGLSHAGADFCAGGGGQPVAR